jgi:hypothetical protein
MLAAIIMSFFSYFKPLGSAYGFAYLNPCHLWVIEKQNVCFFEQVPKAKVGSSFECLHFPLKSISILGVCLPLSNG